MNPRQGIETIPQAPEMLEAILCRKTVNPRQGIETIPQAPEMLEAILCRKTVNPRQGIETQPQMVHRCKDIIRSEDSESSSGD